MPKRSLAALPVLLLVWACASSQSAAPTRRGDSNVIRRAEVNETQLNEMNVHQVIQQLRPRMLQSLGPTSMGPGGGGLVVYFDATRLGNAESLKEVRMAEIEEIRYLGPSEATLRYGTGHDNGVILLRRRR